MLQFSFDSIAGIYSEDRCSPGFSTSENNKEENLIAILDEMGRQVFCNNGTLNFESYTKGFYFVRGRKILLACRARKFSVKSLRSLSLRALIAKLFSNSLFLSLSLCITFLA